MISDGDFAYRELLYDILENGTEIKTRNSVVWRRLNLLADFTTTPLISLRKTSWKSALREMEWFLSGDSNVKNLHPSVTKWWTPWADELGYVAYNYSQQLRFFQGLGDRGRIVQCDQIQYLIDGLTNHPNSRRLVATTWNTAEMSQPDCPITNCHGTVIQCFVEDGKLYMTMYQRSADMVLGTPHNWIQYWALGMYLAHRSNLVMGEFTWHGGDCHIYSSHFEVATDLINQIYPKDYVVPELVYKPTSEEFKADDFSLSAEYKFFNNPKVEMVV